MTLDQLLDHGEQFARKFFNETGSGPKAEIGAKVALLQ